MIPEKKLITVFTPTFNRAYCLHKCYDSLKEQSSYNFEWLIIDDGSTDNTSELVGKWQEEALPFDIRYVYKENGGLHTAYNKGIEHASGELFVCIDSDDWMPCDAIAKIEAIWEQIKDQNYVGIMGMDCYSNGDFVGDLFPDNTDKMFLYEKLMKYKTKGDKKMIQRLDLLRKVAPMKTFEGEKFFNPSYLMYQLDQFGMHYVTNECFCIVDYQPDGMSSNFYAQLRNSPKSFAETRKLYLSFPGASFSFKLRHTIHYVSNCFTAKQIATGFKELKMPLYFCLAFVPGYLLYRLILHKTEKNN